MFMTTKEYRRILKTIAESEKISVEKVEREMQLFLIFSYTPLLS